MSTAPPHDERRIYFSLPPRYGDGVAEVIRKLVAEGFIIHTNWPAQPEEKPVLIRASTLFVGVYYAWSDERQVEELTHAEKIGRPVLALISADVQHNEDGFVQNLLSLLQPDGDTKPSKLAWFSFEGRLSQTIYDEVHGFYDNGGRFVVGGAATRSEQKPEHGPLELSGGAQHAVGLAYLLLSELKAEERDAAALLVALFLNRGERAGRHFLSPFVKQDELLRRLWQKHEREWPAELDLESLISKASDPKLVDRFKIHTVYTEWWGIEIHPRSHRGDEFARTGIEAQRLASEKGAGEVHPRHLFAGALIADAEGSRWAESFLDAETAGWLKELAISWPEGEPVTRDAVNEHLVRAKKFTTPETHRDSAAEKDLLGFKEHAEALAEIIRKKETQAPLVIGVYGPWGSGKSTFMGLVKRRLDELNRAAAPAEGGGPLARRWRRLRRHLGKGRRALKLTTVDYDAWAYVDAPKLWAGLVGKIAKELDAELTLRDRLAYLFERHSRRLLAAAVIGLIPFVLFLLGYLTRLTSNWLNASGLLDENQLRRAWAPTALGGAASAAWAALCAYLAQRRPVTRAVAALSASFDAAPAAGVISRIQDEFKSALRAKIEGEQGKPDASARWPGIRERIRNNELKIVVFIDELDRCPLERIVEILEAIKLFLAEDIFIVLLGVDTRVASEAIRLHYKEVQNPDLPREYLEKIVQLPLRVPSAERPEIEKYLKGFMNVPDEEVSDAAAKEEGAQDVSRADEERRPPRGNGREPQAPAQTPPARAARGPELISRGPGGLRLRGGGLDAPDPSKMRWRSEPAEPPRPAAPVGVLPQLPDTRAEFAALSAIAENFLDSNPRRIKRLLNTYRYVKILAARLPGSEVHAASWQTRMLYWLAFTMRWPAFMEASVAAALAELRKPEEERQQEGAFLLPLLGKPAPAPERPAAELVEQHLPLDAGEIVAYYELAPNFLIENPGAAEAPRP
jgi:hypothetical protein